MKLKSAIAVVSLFAVVGSVRAELRIPAIFGDHMVLQQGMANPVWGWDAPGTKISVVFSGRTTFAIASAGGKWTVNLSPLPASTVPQVLTISGTTTQVIKDVLVGEVWVCSGQSNMEFPLLPRGTFGGDYHGDLEALCARQPDLRLLVVPNRAAESPQDDFKTSWQVSTPETAGKFSAVGFLYGSYLQRILQVPVGLIDNAWGGSAAEAWVSRRALETDAKLSHLMEITRTNDLYFQSARAQTDYESAVAKWRVSTGSDLARFPNPPYSLWSHSPDGWFHGNRRAGNIYNGVLHPLIGYGIKGVIWYQGESNVGRAEEYAELFPFLIRQWRQEWGQGDFPFYWVQLANYQATQSLPGNSAWAELRAAQTQTLQLTNTGQAVAIDLGEGKDIHPKDKHDVAARLVRWALANNYGIKLPYRSPEFKSMSINSNRVEVRFDCFGSSLRAFGANEVSGFAVSGTNRVWRWASAKIVAPDQVEIWNQTVPEPVAISYAWADNPVCNLYSTEGLPATPFQSNNSQKLGSKHLVARGTE